MALPARRIPESVAHLDVEVVAAALIRPRRQYPQCGARSRRSSGDLRKLVLLDQRLSDAALEAVELRLDDAEANLSEALRCGDPRRRDAVSMFMLRNVQRAAKRGYAVAVSAASLEAEPTQPVHYTRRCGAATNRSRVEAIERDGQLISCRDMATGAAMRCIEGEVATPAVLIEHAAAVLRARAGCSIADGTSSAVPDPESAAVRYERERIDAWIRARLIAYPLASLFACRKPILAGQDWQEVSNGDRESALSSDLSRRMAR